MDPKPSLYYVIAALVVLLLAWWIRERSPMVQRQRGAAAIAPTEMSATPSVTPQSAPTPIVINYRLAGVAVGVVNFVAIEHPDGSTALYRVGDDVAGLGRVETITETGATFTSDEGTITLQVTAPAAPTPTALGFLPTARAATRRPSRDRTAPESQP